MYNDFPEIRGGWDWPVNKIEYIYNFDTKEDKMSYAKKYATKSRDKKEQLAIDAGLLREDGTLTSEGLELLAQILLDSHREKFYKAVEELSEEKDGE